MECFGVELMDVDNALQFVTELVVELVPAVADRERNAHGALRLEKGVLIVEDEELDVDGLVKGGFMLEGAANLTIVSKGSCSIHG